MVVSKHANPLVLIYSLVDRLRNDSLLRNSVFIMGSTVITSGIGYLYWIVAARIYSPRDIGLASAFISMMTLISTVTNIGIGYALVQILPRREAGYAWSVTLNASIAVGILTSLLGGFIGAIALPYLSPQFSLAKDDIPFTLTFIMGVVAWTVTVLLDQTFVAERATSNMAMRNTVFAVLKLLLMVILVQIGALGILASWVFAAVATVIFAGLVLIPRLKRDYRLTICGIPEQIRPMLSLFAGHHFVSIGGMLPMYLLPVFVAIRLSVTDNAYFYTTWMVTSIFFIVSPSVATALFSETSHEMSDIMRKARSSLMIILMLLAPILLACFLGGHYILLFFGPSYPQHGFSLLMLLALSAVPDAITNIYVSLLRAQKRLRMAASLNLGMAAITLVLGWTLLPVLGIIGAGWACLIAQSAGTLVAGVDILILRNHESWLDENLAPGLPVQQFIVGNDTSTTMITKVIWLMETSRLPAIGQNYSGIQTVSLVDTLLLPTIKLTAKLPAIKLTAKGQMSSEAGGNKLKPMQLPAKGQMSNEAGGNNLKSMQLPAREQMSSEAGGNNLKPIQLPAKGQISSQAGGGDKLKPIQLPTKRQISSQAGGNKLKPTQPPAKRQFNSQAGRNKLKPIQLQLYNSHPGPTPVTDPYIESQFCERIDDNSTILENEVGKYTC